MSARRPRAEVHERILRAADKLFYFQGIQAVGVDTLAKAAGVSKRTLYKHFASKDDLVAAYLERRAAALTAAEGPPLQVVLGAFENLERWFATQSFRGCPFVNAVAELGGAPGHPALPISAAYKARRRQWFEDNLRQLGVADPGALAEQMVILLEGAIATSLVRGGDPSVAASAGAAARVLLAGAGVKVD